MVVVTVWLNGIKLVLISVVAWLVQGWVYVAWEWFSSLYTLLSSSSSVVGDDISSSSIKSNAPLVRIFNHYF